jgi:SnoaL-like protein
MTSTQRDAPTSAETWVRAFTDGWRAPAGAQELVDHFRPWLRPDYRFSQPLIGTGMGIQEFAERFARPLFTLVPDLRVTVRDWAARGETLFIEVLVEGTIGGRRVAMHGCDRITLQRGLAATRVTYANPAPLLRALARTPRLWPRTAAMLLTEFTRRRR